MFTNENSSWNMLEKLSWNVNGLAVPLQEEFLSLVDRITGCGCTSKTFWQNRYIINVNKNCFSYCDERIEYVNGTYVYCSIIFGMSTKGSLPTILCHSSDWTTLWNSYLPLEIKQPLLTSNSCPAIR